MFAMTRIAMLVSKLGSAVVDSGDPYWNYVILLLHGNEASGSTTFVNSAPTGGTATTSPIGNIVSASTSAKKFGTASMYFGITTSGIVPNSSSNMLVGAGDFCIESWIKIPTVINADYGSIFATGASNDIILSCGTPGLGAGSILGKLHAYPFALESTSTIADNNWHHFAITRAGTTVRMFIDGVQEATATSSQNFTSYNTSYAGIGRGYHLAQPESYFDEFRITKGVARYTASFTPPSAAFGDGPSTLYDPYWYQTVLLMRMDGTNGGTTFTDEKGHTFSIYAGTPALSTTSPKFGSSSIRLLGDGHSLISNSTDDFNFPGDFTVEFFVKFNSYKEEQDVLTTVYTDGFCFKFSSHYSGGSSMHCMVWLNGGSIGEMGPALSTNTWYHIAYARSGSSIRCFVDGVLHTTITNSALLGSSARPLRISTYNGNGEGLDGWLDEIRITKGVARYTANFTPPTLAFPNTPVVTYDQFYYNVSLLMHMDGTNGGTTFTDQKGSAVTAYGNANTSTAQSKFGGTSAYFDGTGDYLSIASNSGLAFGTGDFTIECWVNIPSAVANYQTFFTSRSSVGNADGMWLGLNTGTLYPFSLGNSSVSSSIAINANTWTHVAVVRSAGVLTIYVNGQLGGSAANTENKTNTTASIGYEVVSSNYALTGYIDELRITKDIARYTANFTPPTAAFPNS